MNDLTKQQGTEQEGDKVFIPVAYLHPSEAKTALYIPKLGDGKVYKKEDFNKLLRACKIRKAVIYELAFRVC